MNGRSPPCNMPPSAFLRVNAVGPWIRRRCVVEYDGTDFCGFQAQDQPSVMRTVQEIIENALNRTTGETNLARLRFASRTDTGVHARGQVVVLVNRCVESDRMTQANFDPCVDATRKRYEYELVTGGLRPVVHRRNVWYVRKPLDVAKMQLAVSHMMAPPSAKDFSSFTPQKALDGERGNICTVSTIELHTETVDERGVQHEEDVATRIRLVFEGNRFKYKMVRNMVGTIVDVGLGRLKANEIPRILAAKNRAKAGQGAPPQGLTLVWVKYD
ncbi:unnamed protein product [Peronospora destructor]|uniref:tRNA pseudouridine synthase n=1 Tax=Peronospora destructor TaxID=86335 RepID=A0AAV0T970_9STRA|nr:unnamed protein product [Peronospora destructor]